MALKMAVPVTVANVVEKSVPIQLQAIGNVEAYSTVSVESQVSGYLDKVYFRQGDEVKKDQPLFLIDPRPFQAALDQAKANLARDEAQAEEAKEDARRYFYLWKHQAGTREQYDQEQATADALSATVAADRAAVETARLNLSWCEIRSPIDGRTGNLILHPGNLIKANDSSGVLITIKQIRPIYADFTLPERYLHELRNEMAAHPIKVMAAIPGQHEPETGRLFFIDNNVDSTTGTFALKGLFENPGERLWPGQFVNVTVTLAVRPHSLVVPAEAVQSGQKGKFVYVVDRKLLAHSRPVTVGESLDGQTVIESGVKAGETVVTDGQLRLFSGARVKIKRPLGGPQSLPS